MKLDKYGDIELTEEEFHTLKGVLEGIGVNLIWSKIDGETYTAYARNPYKEAADNRGNERTKKMAETYFDWYKN